MNSHENNPNLILRNIIKDIEKTEEKVWNYHKSDEIKELFLLCLQRTSSLENALVQYEENTKSSQILLKEILEKYSQVKEIVLENNYQRIVVTLKELLVITAKQVEELNITNKIIDYGKRESILNGTKIYQHESEFTSICKQLVVEINKDGSFSKENMTNSLENTNYDIKENISIEKNNEKIKDEKNNTNNKELIHEVIQESIEDIQEYETNKDDPVDITIEIEDKEEKTLTKNDNNSIDETKEVTTPDYEEVQLNQIPEKKYFIDKSLETQDSINDVDKDIKRIIEEHFSYQDSPTISDEEKEEIIAKSVNSNSAKKYAKVLLNLEKTEELEIYEMLGRKLFAQTLTLLQEIDIDPLPYSMSQTWVMWDIAKQLYYLGHPLESNNLYTLENPLESEEKQKEIIYRHLGWIIYKEMTSGKLDNLLANVKNSSYAKKIIDYMIDKPNKGGSLSSYKLADLGKSVVLALKQ
ncbi:MAG: hypothetical protein VXZ40_02620 [Nanoarchaeota archaeon]|nr:hypothetical protein [Nanoarchaeota archaeon]